MVKRCSVFSAPPGASQHQLGTVIDLGSIDDSYADTAEGKWMFKNAWKYGWSLSYPKDMEHITGYKWESWHYRYLGVEACKFQKNGSAIFSNICWNLLIFGKRESKT